MKSLHTLYALLDAFERGDTDGEIFATVLAEDELPKIAAWINDLPYAEAQAMRRRLQHLLEGIERHRQQLCSELFRIQREVLATRKTSQAHIAYLHTAAMGKKLCH